MAEKKKRGLFSWLGFSSEDNDASKEQATDQSVVDGSVDSPKSTHSSDDEGLKASHNHDSELETPIEPELIAKTNDRQLAATLQENDHQKQTIVTDSVVDEQNVAVDNSQQPLVDKLNDESELSLTSGTDTEVEADVSGTITTDDDINTPVVTAAVEQENQNQKAFLAV